MSQRQANFHEYITVKPHNFTWKFIGDFSFCVLEKMYVYMYTIRIVIVLMMVKNKHVQVLITPRLTQSLIYSDVRAFQESNMCFCVLLWLGLGFCFLTEESLFKK